MSWYPQIGITEGRLRGFAAERLPEELVEKAKCNGFSGGRIAHFCGGRDPEARARR